MDANDVAMDMALLRIRQFEDETVQLQSEIASHCQVSTPESTNVPCCRTGSSHRTTCVLTRRTCRCLKTCISCSVTFRKPKRSGGATMRSAGKRRRCWRRRGSLCAKKCESDAFSVARSCSQVSKIDAFVAEATAQVPSEKQPPSAWTLRMYRDVEAMEKLLPYLTLLRGLRWERRHWSQLFRLLGGPNRHLSIDTLTLEDLVHLAHPIALHSDAIRSLDAQVHLPSHLSVLWTPMGQAQGEAALRTSLDELSLWSFERRFDLVAPDATSSVVITQWTKLMDEVEEHLNLVATLRHSPNGHSMKARSLSIAAVGQGLSCRKRSTHGLSN